MRILSQSINPRDPDAPTWGECIITYAKYGALFAAICAAITAYGGAL